jgi:hypothetical protein
MVDQIQPLDFNTPIVDANGRPTPQFLRMWLQRQTGSTPVASGGKRFGFFAEGLLASSELLAEWSYFEDVILDNTNTDTFFTTTVAAAADTDLPINAFTGGVWTTIGNLHLPAGAMSGSLALTTSPYTLSAQMRIQVLAPAIPDISATDYFVLIQGT